MRKKRKCVKKRRNKAKTRKGERSTATRGKDYLMRKRGGGEGGREENGGRLVIEKRQRVYKTRRKNE